ncbi:hypothetical protein CUS07_07305 [Enterococcus faecalis]|nr:hypothetical protein CUS33_09005 [Enterococcus faecalis]PQE59670.1 hypothetical protein CUS07_07305 [Enterococcus faecalis]PQE68679.1 hypothetical protein CUS03_00970 [Enterococcus faecalis]PQE97526.1 hypothetical protein CUS90_10680 [Enterococcus faecalis]PQF56323.1 hypothetical protein CUS66_05720 [Enterococcus faecalis]
MVQPYEKYLKKLFEQYVEKTYDYCPYLESANRKKFVKTDVFLLKTTDPEKISEELFYYFLEKIELFRFNRSRLTKDSIPFYTLNIIFDVELEKSINLDWETIISWPHYMVKYLYSSEQIMFGKFWKNEITKSKFKEGNIPIPSINFLSIRTAIKKRDPLLLSKTKDLAIQIENSVITNNSVIYINGTRIDIVTPDELKEMDYYNYLKKTILQTN